MGNKSSKEREREAFLKRNQKGKDKRQNVKRSIMAEHDQYVHTDTYIYINK
jgi:hypothetical protein